QRIARGVEIGRHIGARRRAEAVDKAQLNRREVEDRRAARQRDHVQTQQGVQQPLAWRLAANGASPFGLLALAVKASDITTAARAMPLSSGPRRAAQSKRETREMLAGSLGDALECNHRRPLYLK